MQSDGVYAFSACSVDGHCDEIEGRSATMQKRTLLLTLTLALISVSEMPTTARATRPRVVEQRVIEIPNTR